MSAAVMVWLISALAGYVMVEGVRRAARMHVRRHGGCRTRPAWAVLYATWIIGAGVAVYDTCARAPQWSTLLLLAGVTMHLVLSRGTWRTGSPLHTMQFDAQVVAGGGAAAWNWPDRPGGQ